MGEDYTQADSYQEETGLSAKFYHYFSISEKRNQLGLYEVRNLVFEEPKIAYKCKSITKLSEWVYKMDQTLRNTEDF